MVISRWRGLALLGALSLTTLLVWAGRGSRPTTSNVSTSSRDQPRAEARGERRPLPEVSTLLEQQTSAYHARLFVDQEGVALVTQTGFAFFRNGEAAEEHSVSLGPVAARQGGSVIFWRSGWLQQVSLSGENERRLVALARAPQYLLASESRVAWIDVDRKTGASLHTISGGDVRVVHRSQDRVCAAVLHGALVYWILQSRDGSWKIGSIGLDGQRSALTAAHQGRPPAMLALGPDGVYFYDGPERGVRRLTFELDREDVVSSHVICSPLVVSNRAICAQVGGLFDLPPGGSAARFLASERNGPITALAATDERVFWVAESGKDQLVVRTARLPEP
jgi:hypothetical protein